MIDYDVCGARLSRMELGALRQLLTVQPDGTVRARDGMEMKPGDLEASGMSPREVHELMRKLKANPVPDLKVEPSSAAAPEEFEERFAAAAPKADQSDVE